MRIDHEARGHRDPLFPFPETERGKGGCRGDHFDQRRLPQIIVKAPEALPVETERREIVVGNEIGRAKETKRRIGKGRPETSPFFPDGSKSVT